ncbi:MAG TPA: hypothetical protein VNZ94_19670 [Xanthobacteraceae bacterium]|nr:hypothetical protein [Xanthobacteraceae bacterium]
MTVLALFIGIRPGLPRSRGRAAKDDKRSQDHRGALSGHVGCGCDNLSRHCRRRNNRFTAARAERPFGKCVYGAAERVWGPEACLNPLENLKINGLLEQLPLDWKFLDHSASKLRSQWRQFRIFPALTA